MADLFYNLAESALGVANAVRPMLAPRYGPPPAIGGDGAPVAPAFAREVAAEVSAPLAPLIPDGETRAGASLATFRQMAHALPTAPDELPDAGDTIAPDGGEPRTPGEEQLAEVAGDASAQMTLATLPERTGGPAAAIAHDGVADVQRKAVEGSMFSAPVSPPAALVPPPSATAPPASALVPPGGAVAPPASALVPPVGAGAPPAGALVPPVGAGAPPANSMAAEATASFAPTPDSRSHTAAEPAPIWAAQAERAARSRSPGASDVAERSAGEVQQRPGVTWGEDARDVPAQLAEPFTGQAVPATMRGVAQPTVSAGQSDANGQPNSLATSTPPRFPNPHPDLVREGPAPAPQPAAPDSSNQGTLASTAASLVDAQPGAQPREGARPVAPRYVDPREQAVAHALAIDPPNVIAPRDGSDGDPDTSHSVPQPLERTSAGRHADVSAPAHAEPKPLVAATAAAPRAADAGDARGSRTPTPRETDLPGAALDTDPVPHSRRDQIDSRPPARGEEPERAAQRAAAPGMLASAATRAAQPAPGNAAQRGASESGTEEASVRPAAGEETTHLRSTRREQERGGWPAQPASSRSDAPARLVAPWDSRDAGGPVTRTAIQQSDTSSLTPSPSPSRGRETPVAPAPGREREGTAAARGARETGDELAIADATSPPATADTPPDGDASATVVRQKARQEAEAIASPVAEAARRISGSLPPAGRQRDGAPIAAPTAQARIASAAETIAAVPTAASAFRHTDDPDPAEQRRGAGPGSSGQVRGAGANDQPITPRREPPPQARSRPPGSTRRAPPIPAGPPTIRVTIGRVEVRTTPGPAPAPARRGGQTQPGLSLDEYLRSRNRGRRE